MKLTKLLACGLAISMSLSVTAPTSIADTDDTANDSTSSVDAAESVSPSIEGVTSDYAVVADADADVFDTDVAEELPIMTLPVEDFAEQPEIDINVPVTSDTVTETEETEADDVVADMEAAETPDDETNDTGETPAEGEEALPDGEAIDETYADVAEESEITEETTGTEELSESVTVSETTEATETVTYKVTLELGYNNAEKTVVNADENGTVALPENITRVGFQFDGWYIDENFENLFINGTEITEDMTVYAKWLDAFEISFVTNGADEIETIYRASILSEADVPTPTLSDALFLGWYTDEECTQPFADYAVTADMILYAKWSKDISERFSVVSDSGYYGEYGCPESGDIVFIAEFADWEEFEGDITAFGMYIYATEDKGVTSTGASVEDFEKANGKFYTLVKDVAVDKFSSTVYAKPYVTINSETFFGSAVSAEVNDTNWLGNK